VNCSWCTAIPGGLRLALQIMPNAKTSEVVGIFDDVLKIRLHAQPIEGQANAALIRFIAQKLGVPKSTVHITHGHTNKRKILEVSARGLTVEHATQALLQSTPD
jgi:uncharacterized protein (TIGR00251 family)